MYGTDNGIYVSDRRAKDGQKRDIRKLVEFNKIEQLDILDEYNMLLILADKVLYGFPVEGLLEAHEGPIVKRAKKIAGHTNFFKSGVCLGRVYVCCVRVSGNSATVTVMEPVDSHSKGKKQPAFKKLLQGSQDFLKEYKVNSHSHIHWY